MIDKGYTREALRRLAKHPGVEFHADDINPHAGDKKRSSGFNGMLKRFIKYGIVEKIGLAQYRKLSTSPVKDYYARCKIGGGRATKKWTPEKPAEIDVPVTRKYAKRESKPISNGINIVNRPDGSAVLFIGNRVFIGQEVAMVSKSALQKGGV